MNEGATVRGTPGRPPIIGDVTDEQASSVGSIVLLVGPSSVGKTAVARALQCSLGGL
jgi:chloramphenicol 3-O-phosphotransferase